MCVRAYRGVAEISKVTLNDKFNLIITYKHIESHFYLPSPHEYLVVRILILRLQSLWNTYLLPILTD